MRARLKVTSLRITVAPTSPYANEKSSVVDSASSAGRGSSERTRQLAGDSGAMASPCAMILWGGELRSWASADQPQALKPARIATAAISRADATARVDIASLHFH